MAKNQEQTKKQTSSRKTGQNLRQPKFDEFQTYDVCMKLFYTCGTTKIKLLLLFV